MERRTMERRKHQRYQVNLEIEMREPDSQFACRGNTTDVSLGGCYVATIFPLAVGAQIEFTLWVAGEAIHGHGSVQTCHPGVGMGIHFSEFTAEAQTKLDQYLHATTPAAAKAASPFLP